MISFSSDPDYFIIRVSSGKQFRDVELLLLSRSIPFTVHQDYWYKLFYIPQHYEPFAKAELQSYLSENKNWPPPDIVGSLQEFRFSLVHVWVVLSLAFFHWYSTRIDSGFHWLEIGEFNAVSVLAGDWWRLFTALTLHVDDAHLLSNAVGLIVFVGGVAYFTGPGLSWLLVFLSAGMGNYFNALFSQTTQPGIGASTAVFSAVGLIGIFGIRNYYRRRQLRIRFFIPLMAGLGLFAMLGTSPQTDVSAHLFGFLSGALLGLLCFWFLKPSYLKNKVLQFFSFVLFCLLTFGSWLYPITFS